MVRKCLFPVLLGIAMLATTAMAVDVTEEIGLAPEYAPQSRLHFGAGVAASGDTVVIGSEGEYASVFSTELTVISLDTTGAGQHTTELVSVADGAALGPAVDVDGDTIVAGSPGAAYVLVGDGAGFDESRLVSPIGSDAFGVAVATADDTVVVGESNRNGSGGAYVFEADGVGGYDVTTLDAPNRPGDRRFGQAVDISGQTIVVGAPADFLAGVKSGAVYVYTPDGAGGYDRVRLAPSDGASGDFFGTSVAISDNRIVVGGPQKAGGGAAYLFEGDGAGGYTETKLVPSESAPADRYGTAVAISGDTIAVGASGFDSAPDPFPSPFADPDGGAVSLFDVAAGLTETRVVPSDIEPQDGFGQAVALSGDLLVVGAPRHDSLESTSFRDGGTYLYGAGTVDVSGASLTIVQDAQPARTTNFSFGGSFGRFLLDDVAVDDGDDITDRVTFSAPPGSYVIRQTNYQRWTPASIDCGGHPITLERTLRGARQRRMFIDLAAGDDVTCTFTNQARGAVSARLFEDLDANGTKNGADRWVLAPWRMTLYDGYGEEIASGLTATDGSARAVFDSVDPGPYQVCIEVRDDWIVTKPAELDPLLEQHCRNVEVRAGATSYLRFGATRA